MLFSALALAAVAAVNAAGLFAIAGSRRAVAEETARLFRADTEARARGLESVLSGTRADLVFLARSSPIARLIALQRHQPPAAEETFRREAAEAALLLFLRSHEEVTRLVVQGSGGAPLLLVGRRGGVPILWVASQPTGGEGAALSPGRPRLTAFIPLEELPPAPTAAPLHAGLEAEIAPSALMRARDRGAGPPIAADRACRVADAAGSVLARTERAPIAGRRVATSAPLSADGWSRPSPWLLECEMAESEAAALVEPVAARYRMTLASNVGAMGLAMLLGFLSVREVARRERLEARAREEARVRDLERQLFHAERLTTVGRLAAGIAHEINNPLEGMANYLGLAKDALERGDVEATRRRLEGVRQGLDRAALVVRQVLAHADPARVAKSPVDLNRVLAETTAFVRSRPEFAYLRFETALSEAPLVVEGSPIMLGQVALNLIVNACEAQPDAGEVVVSSRREGGRALVDVADRGPGIAPAERTRIFEPFFSTKNSTGLGLSICHSILEQHGGSLEVLPRDGGGSIFRLTLPLSAAVAEVA
jgi:signal transduction histidine kinase